MEADVKDRADYYENPKKTDDGRLISSYQCNPGSTTQEFMTVKNI